MPVSRRSILIGAGSIITAAFVKEALALAADTASSATIAGRIGYTNIYYEPFEDHWRLHLGKPQFEIPEPPLLIDNLRFHGYILNTQAQIDDFCDETGWSDAELFAPMKEWDWETQWEHNCSPEAQAFAFLEKHDIFPSGRNGKREGELIFQSYPNPSSSARWVEVHDQFSLTLLQARLEELKLGSAVGSAIRKPCHPHRGPDDVHIPAPRP